MLLLKFYIKNKQKLKGLNNFKSYKNKNIIF